MSRRYAWLILASLMLPASVAAQAIPTATRAIGLQVGGGVSFGKPDYGMQTIGGISLYGDIDVGAHFGLDLELHDQDILTPHDIAEASAVAGVRYKFNFGRLHPYLRAGLGGGRFMFQQGYYPATISYNYGLYAFGGGLDYTLKRHISVRAIDFEYQDWHSFPPNGLTPYVVTIGAAYKF